VRLEAETLADLDVAPSASATEVEILLRGARGALAVVPWPGLRFFRSRPVADGWLTVLRFADPVAVAPVVAELARQAGPDLPFTPVGFLTSATDPVVDLAALESLAPAALRSLLGVRVAATDPPEAVLALAAAGVPLVGAAPGPLGPLVTPDVDLADPLAREEHSLVVRRAALDLVLAPARPSVSILLATRRPEMLEHALAQVARQRGVASLELVLAPHGFTPPAVDLDLPVTVLPQSADTLFGDVLEAARLAASGDVVLKVDDDDWYAPDVVADLLRARVYARADLVGMPAEFHYLTEQDLTVRRGHTSEHYASFVAGGTMMVDRDVLAEVGGFRSVRRYVDAQLLSAVAAAGGTTYRTHGLGYVLRRNPSGHTWQADLDYLLDPARVAEVRPGFAPSRLLELSSAD